MTTALTANAATQAPPYTVRGEAKKNGRIELLASPPAGHHFNIQAPMSLELNGKAKLKPARAGEREIRFEFQSEHPADDKVSIVLYLCDDRKTFCEKQSIQAPLSKLLSEKVPSLGSPGQTGGSLTSPKDESHVSIDHHGFIVNDPKRAMEQAKTEGKPMLIDFFGIWCPPCNELDEQVFGSKGFRKEAAKFVRLKLDADANVSWELKSKYKIGGYPTIVFASPDGDEISRVVGFRPVDVMIEEMKGTLSANSRSESLSALRKKADSGDLEASAKVGLILLERQEFEPAEKYLALSKKHRERELEARIGKLSNAVKEGDKKAENALIEAMQQSLTEFPETPGSVMVRMDLAGHYEERKEPEKRKHALNDAVRLAEKLIQEPSRLKGEDLTPADLWSIIAGMKESLGAREESRKAWKMAAAEYAKGAKARDERGMNLERAYCLWKAGDTAEAERIYTDLEKAYPKEFTFFYAHAGMKLELKELDVANELAFKAFEQSYGDNRIRAAHLLGKVMKAQGRKKEAREMIRSVLASAELPKDPAIRTHRYVKMLRDLDQQLTD